VIHGEREPFPPLLQLTFLAILRRISRMSIFPAAAYEARRILLDVDVYGLDPVSALEKAAKYSASKPFSELLSGYTTVLRTGGDHVNYLNLTPRSATIGNS
jgi:flagellar protein FlaJ